MKCYKFWSKTPCNNKDSFREFPQARKDFLINKCGFDPNSSKEEWIQVKHENFTEFLKLFPRSSEQYEKSDKLSLFLDIDNYYDDVMEQVEAHRQITQAFSDDYFIKVGSRAIENGKFKLSLHMISKKHFFNNTADMLDFVNTDESFKLKVFMVKGEDENEKDIKRKYRAIDRNVYCTHGMRNIKCFKQGDKSETPFRKFNKENPDTCYIIANTTGKTLNPHKVKIVVKKATITENKKMNIEKIKEMMKAIDLRKKDPRKDWVEFVWCSHFVYTQFPDHGIKGLCVNASITGTSFDYAVFEKEWNDYDGSMTHPNKIFSMAQATNPKEHRRIMEKYREKYEVKAENRELYMSRDLSFTYYEFRQKWNGRHITTTDITDFLDDVTKCIGVVTHAKKLWVFKNMKQGPRRKIHSFDPERSQGIAFMVDKVYLADDKGKEKALTHYALLERYGIKCVDYKDIVFFPKKFDSIYLNMFVGFIYEECEFEKLDEFKRRNYKELDDFNLIFYHIYHVLSAGDEEFFEWYMDWLRNIIADPMEKNGVIPCFTGKQGTGKGVFANFLIESVIGRDISTSVGKMKDITGNFNALLGKKMFIALDECTKVSQRVAHDTSERLKNLSMEEIQQITLKGKDTYTVNNYTNFQIHSNNLFFARIGPSDRRYAVSVTSEKHKDDTEYFDRLRAVLSSQVYGNKFGSYLMATYDATKSFRHNIPNSIARQTITHRGLPSPKQYIVSTAYKWTEDNTILYISDYYKRYVDWYDYNRVKKRIASRHEFGILLTDYFKDPVEDNKKKRKNLACYIVNVPLLLDNISRELNITKEYINLQGCDEDFE